MTEEIWKPIPGLRYYEASNLGQIRSVSRITSAGFAGKRKMPGKIIKQRMLNSGYLSVCISEDGRVTYHLTHVLVAKTFIGESPGNHERNDNGDNFHVDHIDNNRTNNRADNLRWIRQWKNVGAKLAPEQVRKIRALYATGNHLQRELADRYGVTRECISRITVGKNWKYA